MVKQNLKFEIILPLIAGYLFMPIFILISIPLLAIFNNVPFTDVFPSGFRLILDFLLIKGVWFGRGWVDLLIILIWSLVFFLAFNSEQLKKMEKADD